MNITQLPIIILEDIIIQLYNPINLGKTSRFFRDIVNSGIVRKKHKIYWNYDLKTELQQLSQNLNVSELLKYNLWIGYTKLPKTPLNVICIENIEEIYINYVLNTIHYLPLNFFQLLLNSNLSTTKKKILLFNNILVKHIDLKIIPINTVIQHSYLFTNKQVLPFEWYDYLLSNFFLILSSNVNTLLLSLSQDKQLFECLFKYKFESLLLTSEKHKILQSIVLYHCKNSICENKTRYYRLFNYSIKTENNQLLKHSLNGILTKKNDKTGYFEYNLTKSNIQWLKKEITVLKKYKCEDYYIKRK